MTLVDFIELSDDECYSKEDVIDLSSGEDSVPKDGNVEEHDNVPQSKNLAEAATSSPISEPDCTAVTPLSIVDNGSTMSSLMTDKSMQTENQEFLDVTKDATQPENHELTAAGDCVGKAMLSEREAGVFSSTIEQAACTSLLLTEQGAITSSLREDKSMQSGNQVFVAAVDCAKEAMQSENTAKAAGSMSMTERGATCKSHHVGQLCQTIGCPHIVGDVLDLCISHGGHPHGEPGSSIVPCTKSEVSIKHERHSGTRVKGAAGNAIGSTGIYNLHAQEELEGDTEKEENCDFEAETKTLSPQENEKETIRFGKFYDRKEQKQVDTGYLCHRMHHTLHNGDGRISVMGNVCDGAASIGINVLDGKVLVSTYQECSKTFQGNTMYGRAHDNGSKSKGCMVEGCTNGAHGGTTLCVFHNSRPHEWCCAVIGCTNEARQSSQGLKGCCVMHGGGKRCKYDGCEKSARGKTDCCTAHGGGRRCKFEGCRKSAQTRSDYCVDHGSGRRCKFLGCSASTTCGKELCYTHITSLLSGNNSDHEILPAPTPAFQAKKAEPSKGRNSHSVIGGRSQKKQNTSDYVNNRSFNVVETGEENGRVFICQNNMPKAQDKEKDISQCKKFSDRKEKEQVDRGYLFHRMQQRLHNEDSGISVTGKVCDGAPSVGINVLDGEVLVSTYQECSKIFQGNTTDGKVRNSGSKGCIVQGCTNSAHGGTTLCIFHNSRPNKRCCAVTGCTKIACKVSEGRTDHCVKHGGGKRCKYDGCGKGAQGNTDFCIAHGGGRRCKFQGCKKSAQGRCDYCIRHGGGRRCKFPGCSASATCGTDFCYMHRISLSSGSNSDREMLPAPAHEAKKAELSKRRSSHSVIGGRSQKRQNTNDYVNNVIETGEKKGRVFVCENDMLKAQ